MRFDGIIKTWNDERGFGFIESTQGGQEIFVHIKDFTSRTGRPQIGQQVTFEVELNPEGKKRAKGVSPLRSSKPISHSPKHSVQWGMANYVAILGFLLVYLVTSVMWRVPSWVAGLYVVASIVTILIYAVDKSAAIADQWRVSESTLLSLGLVGGWPGAIVAQLVLRHKSSKASFRKAFWLTVVFNIIGFTLLVSPLRQRVLGM